MYARVGIVTDSHPNALVVPTNSVVDVNGTRGVYLAVNNVAQFRPVKIGIENNTRTEILDGVSDGDRVVTTGAPALRNGDPIVLAGRGGPSGRQTQGGRAGAQPSDQVQGTPGRQGGSVGAGGFGARRGGGASQGTGGSEAAPGGDTTGERGGAGRRGGVGGRRGQGPAGVPQATPETR
jgi:hypothetical protein